MNKYYLLSFIIGILHKLYDDLYDNDLYEYFNISEINKLYLNELLKCLFIIGFSVISIKNIFFFIWFSVIITLIYFFKKTEYGPYEFSGLISTIFLIPFLNWNYDELNKQNILFTIITLFGSSIFEKLCFINIEYSYSKLIFRSVVSIFIFILLFINYLFLFLRESVILCLLFILGYLLTSCIFQFILVTKNNSVITLDCDDNKCEVSEDKCENKSEVGVR